MDAGEEKSWERLIARRVAAMHPWSERVRYVDDGDGYMDEMRDRGPCLFCACESEHARDCTFVLATMLCATTPIRSGEDGVYSIAASNLEKLVKAAVSGSARGHFAEEQLARERRIVASLRELNDRLQREHGQMTDDLRLTRERLKGSMTDV